MSGPIVILASKADSIVDPVPDTYIHIDRNLPPSQSWLTPEEWGEACDLEAKQIEEALIVALPGAVYDRLLGRMLARKASHFRVAHGTGKEDAIRE